MGGNGRAGNSNGSGAQKLVGRPFQPGISGNPSGRPKVDGIVMELARKHTKEAITTLAKLMRASDSDKVRVMAAVALLDRGWGRPNQALEVGDRDGNPLMFTLAPGIPQNGN